MGAPRHKATDPTVLGPIRERWNTMTVGERDTATVDVVQELKAQWEMKQVAQHQVPLASLGDSQRTLESIQKEVSQLILHRHCHNVFSVHSFTARTAPRAHWRGDPSICRPRQHQVLQQTVQLLEFRVCSSLHEKRIQHPLS